MGAARQRRLALLALLAAWPAIGQPGEPAAAAAPGPAYLVYAGPYASSPSSAFGHLFLVLADGPLDPPPLWSVFTFNAVTFGVDPVRYLTVGIAGGFLGRFERFPFHEKTRDYELLDDRDLWLLELRLSGAQRAALAEVTGRALGRWYPYAFFQRNCAHYLQAALAEATGALPEPSGVTSPAGAFMLAQASPVGGASFHRRSASGRLDDLAAGADPALLARLRSEDWQDLAADQGWLSGLGPRERLVAQAYFAMKSLRTGTLLPAGTSEGLARLRLLNAEPRTEGPADATDAGAGLPVPPPAFHDYRRVRLRYASDLGGPGRLLLGARAAMHDEADPWLGLRPASTLEFLGLEVSSPVDRARLRLESATLFSQRALVPSDWMIDRGAWLLEAVARRGGLFGQDELHLEARGGLGRAWGLPAGSVLHGLVTLAATGAFGQGATLAPGLEVGLVALTASRFRLGGTWKLELDPFAWPRSAQRTRLWARLDLGPKLGAILTADAVGTSRWVGAGLDWYP